MKTNLTIGIPIWLDKICAWPLMLYRKYKYGWPFRRIPLGQGIFTIVEPQDYYWLNHYHWSVKINGSHVCAVRLVGTPDNKTKILSMHREIMNAPKGLLVDHKNRHSLDNRRANLRLATRTENNINCQRDKSKTSSRFRGVSFNSRDGRYKARIRFQGKSVWLGYFDSEIDAAKAYDEAAKKYHGEFARLNFAE